MQSISFNRRLHIWIRAWGSLGLGASRVAAGTWTAKGGHSMTGIHIRFPNAQLEMDWVPYHFYLGTVHGHSSFLLSINPTLLCPLRLGPLVSPAHEPYATAPSCPTLAPCRDQLSSPIFRPPFPWLPIPWNPSQSSTHPTQLLPNPRKLSVTTYPAQPIAVSIQTTIEILGYWGGARALH